MSSIAGELLNFLTPKLDDPLQVGFLTIIVGMIGYTVISAHLVATPVSWEKKWNRGTPDSKDDDLDIEHGSVTDLWYAVATAPEKLAEIMPGMLLVIGLLGTFLGLGMALNHASNILSQSNAIASSMSDLTGMLQGLGTKFKTSTWGIIGFVLLKIWSEVTRLDEKRLAWVIDKVKVELRRKKAERLVEEGNKQKALFECIVRASVRIVEGVQAGFVKVGEGQQKLLAGIDRTLTQTQGEINASLAHIQETSLISSTALSGFTQNTQQIIQQMADAAKEMVEGSNQVSSAAKGLEKVVDEFGSEFKEVLDNVRKDLGSAIETMSERSSATMKEGSEKLNGATKEISTALSELSKDVKDTMNKVESSIGTALELQKKAAIEFTTSTQTLNENIETTTQTMEKLGKDITSGMSSVADAGQRMGGIGKNLDSIGKRLENQVPLLENISKKGDADASQEAVQKLSSIENILKGLTKQSASKEVAL
ncbi:hypothetical protein [Brachymonas sp.]|uniref:hypothetical protein n=1 Tax=Brachymonas sp. TaxID=1936292 RepID=UPI0035AF325E